VARVEAALARLNHRVEDAQRAGQLAAFNAEYRRRRCDENLMRL